jgi:hypothetical protein
MQRDLATAPRRGRVSRAGLVTIAAGQPGTAGNLDGPASQARFRGPRGLAFHASTGRLLIAESAATGAAGPLRFLDPESGRVGSLEGTEELGPLSLAQGPGGRVLALVAEGRGGATASRWSGVLGLDEDGQLFRARPARWGPDEGGACSAGTVTYAADASGHCVVRVALTP